MKKILMIGAGVEQLPAIVLAKEMGYSIIATDMNINAPGMHIADKKFKVSTTDKEGNIKVANDENIDGVMTVCSETAVPTVANVASYLDLPGYSPSTALKATNKVNMREELVKNNINVSPYIIANDFNQVKSYLNNVEGPYVIKPADSSGQRGTFLVKNKDELKNAFKIALSYSPTKTILIDQFIKGNEIHVVMQVINNEVYFLALSDRVTLNNQNFGIAVRHVGPSIVSYSIEEKIKKICRDSVKAIGLENGVATCEIVLYNDELFLMEIAIRVPGGYLREVAMYLSGVDVIKTTIWNCLGKEIEFNEMRTEESFPAVSVKFISNLNLAPSIKKIISVNNLNDFLSQEGIKKCTLHFKGEYIVPELNSSVGRFGAIIGVGNSREDAVKKTEEVFNLIRINNLPLQEYSNYNPYNFEFK